MARRAAELGKEDAVALASGGFALAIVVGEAEGGAALIDRALALSPNLAWAWLYSGSTRMWLGQSDVAIEHLARAMRRAHSIRASLMCKPQPPTRISSLAVMTKRLWAEKALAESDFRCPERYAWLRRVMRWLGSLGHAQKSMTRLLELDPTLRGSNLKDRLPPLRPEHFAHLAEGLRKAGLPE